MEVFLPEKEVSIRDHEADGNTLQVTVEERTAALGLEVWNVSTLSMRGWRPVSAAALKLQRLEAETAQEFSSSWSRR